jgi:hypothetical protein
MSQNTEKASGGKGAVKANLEPTFEFYCPFEKKSKRVASVKEKPHSAIAKVNIKLDSVEKTLETYIPFVKQLIDKHNGSSCDSEAGTTESTEEEGGELIDTKKALRTHSFNNRILAYQDYPKHMISFFFTMEEYCGYPRVLELDEFFSSLNNFTEPLPDYLLSAMISDSCLTSPHPTLYCQNTKYSDHYYQLSLNQVEPHLANPNIHVVQALLILFGVDESRGRLLKCVDRITTALKIAQVLRFDEIEDPSSFVYQNSSPEQRRTISKLWKYIAFVDYHVGRISNRPSLIPNLDSYELVPPNSFSNQQLIRQCEATLPFEYTDFFHACTRFVQVTIDSFKYTGSLKNGFLPDQHVKQCLQTVENFLNWHKTLPESVQYHQICLNPIERMKNPLYKPRVDLYERMNRAIIHVYRCTLRYYDYFQPLQLVQFLDKCITFSNEVMEVLYQQFQSLLELSLDNLSEKNLPNDSKNALHVETYHDLGAFYLDLLKCIRSLRFKVSIKLIPQLSMFESIIRTKFDTLMGYFDYFKNNWDTSLIVMENLKGRLAKIDILPCPPALFQMDFIDCDTQSTP